MCRYLETRQKQISDEQLCISTFHNVKMSSLVFREFRRPSMVQLTQGGDLGTRLRKRCLCFEFTVELDHCSRTTLFKVNHHVINADRHGQAAGYYFCA